MQFVANTIDDLLYKIFRRLLSSSSQISPTRGDARELIGVVIELRNPRARLSRTETRGRLYSSLGEFLWYLSKDNKLDFIERYIPAYAKESEDGQTVHGGYGPRIFAKNGYNQLEKIVDLLTRNPNSRRAVVQIFDALDVAEVHKEVPCTCTLQFLVRNGYLHMITHMRSNDAYKGLPHDIFCFSMLHELVTRSLNLKIGVYRQFVGSLHLYDTDMKQAQQYLGEGVQPTILMPAMPQGDPWPAIQKLLDAESNIRHGNPLDDDIWTLDDYWTDLVRLLQIYAASGDRDEIKRLKAQMSYKKYGPYIDTRAVRPRRAQPAPSQPTLI